jgi:hypothetical protein
MNFNSSGNDYLQVKVSTAIATTVRSSIGQGKTPAPAFVSKYNV